MVHGDNEKAASYTRTSLRTTGPVPADSRRCTPSVHNCVRDKLGAGPMAMDAVRGRRRRKREESVSKHPIQPQCNKRTGAGRVGQTRLAKPYRYAQA